MRHQNHVGLLSLAVLCIGTCLLFGSAFADKKMGGSLKKGGSYGASSKIPSYSMKSYDYKNNYKNLGPYKIDSYQKLPGAYSKSSDYKSYGTYKLDPYQKVPDYGVGYGPYSNVWVLGGGEYGNTTGAKPNLSPLEFRPLGTAPIPGTTGSVRVYRSSPRPANRPQPAYYYFQKPAPVPTLRAEPVTENDQEEAPQVDAIEQVSPDISGVAPETASPASEMPSVKRIRRGMPILEVERILQRGKLTHRSTTSDGCLKTVYEWESGTIVFINEVVSEILPRIEFDPYK